MSKIKDLALSFLLILMPISSYGFDSGQLRIRLTKSPLSINLIQQSIQAFENIQLASSDDQARQSFMDEVNCQSLSQSNLKLNFFQGFSTESSQQIDFTCDGLSSEYAEAMKNLASSDRRAPASLKPKIVTIIISSN